MIKKKYLLYFLVSSIIFSNSNQDMINKMNLKDKIAQMIMVRVRSDYYSSDNYYKKQVEKWIENQKSFDFEGSFWILSEGAQRVAIACVRHAA